MYGGLAAQVSSACALRALECFSRYIRMYQYSTSWRTYVHVPVFFSLILSLIHFS